MRLCKDIRMLVVFLLGMTSGLPLALSASTLGVMLIDNGINIKEVAVFGLASVPYAFKYLWAPLIDGVRLPIITQWLGRRRSWLVTTQLFLCGTIICTGEYVAQDANLLMLGIMVFSIAFFSATQDVIIDAYRIDILSDSDQGMGAAVATFGYRIGMLISGAGCMMLAEYFGWGVAYLTIALMLLPGAIAALLYGEPKASMEIKQDFDSVLEWIRHSFCDPFLEFLKYKNWVFAILLIMAYKLSDAFIGILTAPFLMDIGFSKLEIAAIVKVYGFIATICGMFIAGYLLSRSVEIKKMLFTGLILQALSNLAFVVQSHYGHDNSVLIVVIFIENFCSGLSNAALVSYISVMVKKEFSATHYAVLSSLAVLGRTTISTTSGMVASALGWTNFFAFSMLLSLPALLCLYYLYYKKS